MNALGQTRKFASNPRMAVGKDAVAAENVGREKEAPMANEAVVRSAKQ
jgi:hypothetical protein